MRHRARRGSGLPEDFVARVRADLGPDEGERLVAALGAPPAVGLRANSRVGDVRGLVRRLGWDARPLPWAREGVALDRGTAAWSEGTHPAATHPWHDAGAYYLQDPSAMGVVPLLDPRPGEWVLDLAAAPGGKSTYIADRLAGTGLLWSHDVDQHRAGAVVGNLERWGAAYVVVTHGPVTRLAPLRGAFDRVLLDAPCSGEGMFRKSPAALDLWSRARVAEFCAMQAALLDEAVEFLKPGGVLVYATCTFGSAENEGAIGALLGRRHDVVPESVTVTGASGGLEPHAALAGVTGAVARWWPHLHDGDGHFAARLRKIDGPGAPPASRRRGVGDLPGTAPGRADVETFEAFCRDVLGSVPPVAARLRRFGDWLHAVPAADLPSGGASGRGDRAAAGAFVPRRVGAPLGRHRGGRFEPHHALARLLPSHGDDAEHLDLPPDDPRTAAYLRGEVIAADVPDGWLVVRCDGLPLGWAKAKRGELNNGYPKGLRRG